MRIPILIFSVLLILLVPTSVSSETYKSPIGVGVFQPGPKLKDRVEFWKLIFTKYGKNHAVLHHRLHPHIIYSVLDFSDFEKKYKGKKLKNKKKEVLKKERTRVSKLLGRLESGKVKTAEEKRLFALFQKLPGSMNTNLKKAKKRELLRSQTGIKERFRGGLERSGRYLYAIERIFRDQGLPVQLARLPLVESSFDYEAKSSVGAAGIWQFMRSTGKLYMRINSSMDERRDAIMATRGAVQYLKHAQSRLDAWPLALTSYNHGVAGVMRAVKKTGTKDLSVIIDRYKSRTFGFASSNFYPSFLAALEVDRNAKTYFPDLVREEPWYFDEIRLSSAKPYSLLKKAADFPEAELKKFNPGFLKSIYNGRARVPSGYLLKVPAGKGRKYAEAIGNAKLVSIHEGTKYVLQYKKSSGKTVVASSGGTHKVRRGENIGSIARRYGVNQKSLMSLNKIRDPRRLRAGQRLKIPSGGKRVSAVKIAKASPTYTVKRGDTLSVIAKRHGLKLSRLRGLNPGLKSRIHPGQKLKVK